MKFPTFVYRSPGPHMGRGGTYRHKRVASRTEAAEALADGWYPTVKTAIKPPPSLAGTWGENLEDAEATEDPVPKEVAQGGAPTSAELRAEAKRLGIGYNNNTRDQTLIDKISAAAG